VFSQHGKRARHLATGLSSPAPAGRFSARYRRIEGISPKGTVALRLKMPVRKPYDGRLGRTAMFRRLVLILGVIAMGLALNGCTKCGPIWDDWLQAPKSCKSDHL
jgi:hypothetical protein